MKNNYFFKRVLSAVLLLMVSSFMWAWDFQVGDLYYNVNKDGESVEVTYASYGGYSGDIVIPSIVSYEGKTYSVTSIGSEAFYGCTSLTSVEIGNSVTSIGYYAFAFCYALTSIVIPNNVTSIEDRVFYSCYALTSIEIGNSVTSIGDETFQGCSSLTSIEIPNSVTSIGKYAFWNCSSLTSVNIPNSVTSIEDRAFQGCSSLISIEIPNSVTSIGHDAGNGVFQGCSSLTSIIVADDNPVYDSREDCNAIIETTSNTLIIGCQNTVIPSSVTSIGYSAFYGCNALTSIVIPNSVTSIRDMAFLYCSSLTSVICYAEDVPELGWDVFAEVPQSEATLYVPASALEAYKAADQWKDFGTILQTDEDATGIASPTAEQEADATYYTLDGVSMKNPTKKGIYIKNGKKVYMQ